MRSVMLAGCVVALTSSSAAAEPLLRDGSYEITARLELPHLERWAVDRTKILCLGASGAAGKIPIPVLSVNNPFALCEARNVTIAGELVQYDIVCPGRDSARAHAVYKLQPDGFAGYLAMVMGGKNMTMIERQHARRRADCPEPQSAVRD